MINPTDQDIAEALQLAGFAKPDAAEIACMRDEHKNHGTWKFVLAHARTIAKLRIAVEALEYAHAHVPTSNAWFVVHDALAKIKEAGNG